jgi:hypothetical protein
VWAASPGKWASDSTANGGTPAPDEFDRLRAQLDDAIGDGDFDAQYRIEAEMDRWRKGHGT